MAKKLKITAILLFVIVDIVAAVLTFRHVNQRPASSGAPLVTPSVEPSPTTQTPTPTEKATPTGLIVADGLVARFAHGSCDRAGAAHIELSVDQAKTFKEIGLPLEEKADADGNRPVAVSSLLAVKGKAPQELSIVATDRDCKAHQYTTKDSGQSWKLEDSITDWYVDNARVVSPDGPVDAQCEVDSVSLVSDRNAKVGCKNDEIRSTDDTGATWTSAGIVEDLNGISFSGDTNGVAVATGTECKSRVYETVSAGETWAPISCIDKGKNAVAMGGSDGFLAALLDGEVRISTDAGKTWKNP